MTRRHIPPAETLARALRDAYLDAYLEANPHGALRAVPGWEEVNQVGRLGWERVAAHMLKRGVRPPEVK